MTLPALLQGDVSPPMDMIDKLCAERERVLEAYRDLLKAFERTGRRHEFGYPRILVNSYEYLSHDKSMEKITQEVDATLWLRAIEECGFSAIMTANDLDELRQQIKSNPMPFERETVAATLLHHFRQAPEKFAEGLVQLFKRLDRNFKSHDGWKLGRRIILHGLDPIHGWSVWSKGREYVNDLSRMLLVLDGGNPAALGYEDQHALILERAKRAGETEVDTPYFHCKFFGNGNVHLYPLRGDLIERANEVIAAHYGRALNRNEEKTA